MCLAELSVQVIGDCVFGCVSRKCVVEHSAELLAKLFSAFVSNAISI